MLPLVILLEFGGGLAILFGFLTRTTALFTAGFTLLTAFLFHSNFAEGVNSLMFMKNLTISGGFLLLAITGPGAYSIDRLLNKSGKHALYLTIKTRRKLLVFAIGGEKYGSTD